MGLSKCDVLKLFCPTHVVQETESYDQRTDLFLELRINYIKYPLDQLLLRLFIENCISNNSQPALKACSDAQQSDTHPWPFPQRCYHFCISSPLSYPFLILFPFSFPLISRCPIPQWSIEEWEDIQWQWRVIPLQDDQGICQTPEEIQQFVIVQRAEVCGFWSSRFYVKMQGSFMERM